MDYIPTRNMLADGLIKNLLWYKFKHFRAFLNLEDVREII